AAIALIAALPTCVLGAWLYTLLTGRGAALVIGATLIATVPLRRLLRSRGHKLGEKAYIAAAAGWGIVVGGTTGAVVIMLSLLMAAGLEGAAVIATDAAVSLGMGIVKIAVFGAAGVLTQTVVAIALLIGVCRLSMHIPGEAHRRAPACSRAYRYSRCRRRHRRYDDDLGRLPIIGAAGRYGPFTTGGSDDKIDSTLPPVRNPKIVPRS